MVGSYK